MASGTRLSLVYGAKLYTLHASADLAGKSAYEASYVGRGE